MSAATFCIALLPGLRPGRAVRADPAAAGADGPGLLRLRGVRRGVGLPRGVRARRNAAASTPASSPPAPPPACCFGSLLAALLSGLLTGGQMHVWGWRLPFLLAAPLGPDRPLHPAQAGGHARSSSELEQRDHVQGPGCGSCSRRTAVPSPSRSVSTCLNAVGFYVMLSYMPTYLSTELGVGETAVLPGHDHRAGLPTSASSSCMGRFRPLRPQEDAHRRLGPLRRC